MPKHDGVQDALEALVRAISAKIADELTTALRSKAGAGHVSGKTRKKREWPRCPAKGCTNGWSPTTGGYCKDHVSLFKGNSKGKGKK